VRRGKDRLTDLGDLGWEEPLVTFRPFLSYSELGAVVAAPSKLYDELKSILGLEEVTATTKLLAEARNQRKKQKDAVKARGSEIRQKVEGMEDPRAEKCRDLMSKPRPDLGAIETVVLGDLTDGQEETALTRLRRLAQLTCPELDEVQTMASLSTEWSTRAHERLDAHAPRAPALCSQLRPWRTSCERERTR
jgi:hypothetical protein